MCEWCEMGNSPTEDFTCYKTLTYDENDHTDEKYDVPHSNGTENLGFNGRFFTSGVRQNRDTITVLLKSK